MCKCMHTCAYICTLGSQIAMISCPLTVSLPPYPIDHSTIWNYPSSSSQPQQAHTLACCSSNQKQVEVSLFSWPVRPCLELSIHHPTTALPAGWLALSGYPPLHYSSWDGWVTEENRKYCYGPHEERKSGLKPSSSSYLRDIQTV